MANYVLVHGGNMTTETWNKLTVGKPVYTKDGHLANRYWDGTVAALRAYNHRVFAPALQDEHTSNLTGHTEQVCALIVENNMRDIILVGHSYGGMVITGVADRIPDRIRRLVYLDAALPDSGQSLFNVIASGGCDPLSFSGLEPAAAYVEKLQFNPAILQRLRKTYILCTKSEFAVVTEAARKKIAAAINEWTYIELPSSHVPMADMPDEFNKLMLAAAE